MTWLVWRQYRAQAAIASVLLVAAAAVILADGFQIASHWHSILVTCSGNSACLQQQGPLVNGVVSDLPDISLIVPAVLGMLWGRPGCSPRAPSARPGWWCRRDGARCITRFRPPARSCFPWSRDPSLALR